MQTRSQAVRSQWLPLAATVFALQQFIVSASQQVGFPDLLGLYDRGRYEEFLVALATKGVVNAQLFDAFEKDAQRWVKESPALQERRTIIAASVALEIAHLLRDKPADWAGRYLVWASRLMLQSVSSTPSERERLWYLACLAGMEELDEPQALTWGQETGSAVLAPMARSLGAGGQLAIALKRFPDEPRFQLTRVVAMEFRLRDQWGLEPSYLELARANAAVRVPTDPRSDDDITAVEVRNTAVRTMSALANIPVVIREYQALAMHEGLRAEIHLHIGGLESRLMRWPEALGHLRRVSGLTDEPYLLYLAQLLTGRTLHNMGDNAGAVTAFESATALVPHARTATTWLAATLWTSETSAERDRAYPLLERVYVEKPAEDPWRLYLHGDARLWPTYMAQLRQALQ